ncbi:pantetheine-phosphate adenylyltransferase [Zhaonella formicivorans]|uniref:pantetheine-phosphate adenylyltransferase n=1 Tax=Zhaonella formicivorans TaxID=2528593 RepID=UPI001D126B1B|nr:pantetheine-phosphate adenylyltransferase [Zhaonella formicivorans]
MRIAIYPGTFDPVTNGHLDILERAATLFDEVIVAVAEETYKTNLFSLQERADMLRQVIINIPNARVETFSGLLMDYVKAKGACAVVRGLRAVSDFEYEFQISMMNKKLHAQAETIFLTTASEYSFISSSIIKQVAALGGCVTGLVPSEVEKALKQKFQKS